MTTFDSIMELSSFENCRGEVIAREKMGKILEAGRNAPSPGNVQSLEFIAVEDKNKLEMLSNSVNDDRVAHAPTAVIVLADIGRMSRRIGAELCYDCCNAEVACAVQNMRLTAAEEDIASCWISGFDGQLVSEQFRIPEAKEPLAVVIFGYTDDPINPPQKFGMNSVCFYDEYGNQVGSVFDAFEFRGLKDSTEIYSRRTKGLIHKMRRKVREFL